MDATEVRLWAIRKTEEVHGTKLLRENPEQFLTHASQLSLFLLSGSVRPVNTLSPVNDGNNALKQGERLLPIERGIVPVAVNPNGGDALEQCSDKPLSGESFGHVRPPVSGVATETVAAGGDGVSNGAVPALPSAA